jgi:hypothetical protein
LGSGPSIQLEYPSWNELTKGLLEEILSKGKLMKEQADNYRIWVQNYCSGKHADRFLILLDECHKDDPNSFSSYIKMKFSPKSGENYTETHKILIELGFSQYLTTNYDQCLEDAWMSIKGQASKWVRRGEVGFEEALKGKLVNGYIVHLHGRYDAPDDCVVTIDQYHDFYGGTSMYGDHFTNVEFFFREVLKDKPLLFLGYGFRDLDINIILLKIHRFLNSVYHSRPLRTTRYAFIRHPSDWKDADLRLEALYYERTFGIRPIFYPADDGDHSKLEDALKELSSQKKTLEDKFKQEGLL